MKKIMFLMSVFVFCLFSVSGANKIDKKIEEMKEIYLLFNQCLGDKSKEEFLKQKLIYFSKETILDLDFDPKFDLVGFRMVCSAFKKYFTTKLKAEKDEKFIIAMREMNEKINERFLEMMFGISN